MHLTKQNLDKLKLILAILIVFIISFPKFQILYGTGLDWSYKWALNFLFDQDYDQLTKIVYPIGPLGILKMPVALGDNLLVSLMCFTAVKLFFIYLCFEVSKLVEQKSELLVYLLVLISSYFIHVDFLYMACTFLLCLLSYFKKGKWNYQFIIAIVITAIGYFIKTSIGISSVGIVLTLLAIEFFESKDYKTLFTNIGVVLITYVLLGLIVFRGFSSFFAYMVGSFYYVKGYSAALSVYPDNNWFALVGFFVSIGLLFFLKKERILTIALLLLIFPLFTSWKHGVSREHATHYEILIYFMLVFAPLVVLLSQESAKKLSLLLVTAISCLFINYNALTTPKEIVVEPVGIQKFYSTFFDFEELNDTSELLSIADLKGNRLNDSILSVIGNSSVDVFPWELSYVPANNLNWQPRTLLQSGGFSHWFDSVTANGFTRGGGPEKILYHLVTDEKGNNFSSIDNRLLLNDHPITFLNILNNYKIIAKIDDFLIFEKNNEDVFVETKLSDKKEIGWNEWVKVPESGDDLLRVKVSSSQSILGSFKSALYKPEAYYIDYRLKNDSILSYRYVSSNAEDGLWINPWLEDAFSDKKDVKVKSFRLRTSNELFNKSVIDYQFEQTALNDKLKDGVNGLFHKHRLRFDTLLFSEVKFKEVLKIEPKGFSGSYEFDLKEFWSKVPLEVEELNVACDLKFLNKESLGNTVISVEHSDSDLWLGQKMPASEEWGTIKNSCKLERALHDHGKLKVYNWNNGENEVSIKEFRIEIIGE